MNLLTGASLLALAKSIYYTFQNAEKQTVPCERTAKEASFEG